MSPGANLELITKEYLMPNTALVLIKTRRMTVNQPLAHAFTQASVSFVTNTTKLLALSASRTNCGEAIAERNTIEASKHSSRSWQPITTALSPDHPLMGPHPTD